MVLGGWGLLVQEGIGRLLRRELVGFPRIRVGQAVRVVRAVTEVEDPVVHLVVHMVELGDGVSVAIVMLRMVEPHRTLFGVKGEFHSI